MANTFDPFRELDRVAGALFDNRLRDVPMDLYRQGDHYILSADLPGIDPGSVDIDVDGQLLTIRAERTLGEQEGVKWLTRERRGGSFVRQLNLGQGINIEAITAHYNNGVLMLTIPVRESAKPRKIAVETGSRDNGADQIEGEATSAPGGQGAVGQ
ncbi:Hsp20/alpha crystallin family protein [Arthrobacter sp. KK5.5]|uniref:Hsp20/alpha crystallin family protein n=1 Tax=Arthrobacter sp. KK5.5 TaxID=3373084 RepID=UPI003EE7A4C3